MGIFNRNPFGHILFVKKFLIRIFAVLTHKRYRGFNDLQIEGKKRLLIADFLRGTKLNAGAKLV